MTDASSLTEAGFVGADVEVAVRNLYYAADKDVERAEHGIIYLDEFDKIARKSGANNSITADPGHEGVQQALLKMLEGSVVEFTARGQRKHPEAPTIKVDTKNILFIVGGAFVGIEKVISKRLKKGNVAIGFGAEVRGKDIEKEFDTLIHQVTPEDLMEYGIIPEIIGVCPSSARWRRWMRTPSCAFSPSPSTRPYVSTRSCSRWTAWNSSLPRTHCAPSQRRRSSARPARAASRASLRRSCSM